MDVVYADIMRLESTLKPLEKKEFSTKFLLPVECPDGKYTANVRFGDGMSTITDSSINFYVLGMNSETESSIKVLILFFWARYWSTSHTSALCGSARNKLE